MTYFIVLGVADAAVMGALAMMGRRRASGQADVMRPAADLVRRARSRSQQPPEPPPEPPSEPWSLRATKSRPLSCRAPIFTGDT